jgi:hypothetical protein
MSWKLHESEVWDGLARCQKLILKESFVVDGLEGCIIVPINNISEVQQIKPGRKEHQNQRLEYRNLSLRALEKRGSSLNSQ